MFCVYLSWQRQFVISSCSKDRGFLDVTVSNETFVELEYLKGEDE